MSTEETRLRKFANMLYPLYAPIVHRTFLSDLEHHTSNWRRVTWLGIPIIQDLLNIEDARVITIDVQKRHSLEHPRITWLIGPSTSDEVVNTVKNDALKNKPTWIARGWIETAQCSSLTRHKSWAAS